MNKIVSLMLAMIMLFSLCGFTFAKSYTDLTKDNEKYINAVNVLTELKVIDGFEDGTFRPQEKLTRAQMAKMLVICMGLRDEAELMSAKTVFSDVDASHWASGYINAAAQSKLIIGYPDGSFQPEKEVTYAEAITMVLRALGYGNVVESEGTWPTSYMLKAVELQLTRDMDNISTNAAATRGNTAILLWNMLRTEMWRIASESQGNGMTRTNTGDYMLNVKFPGYDYVEDVYVEDIYVTDAEDVVLTLSEGDPAQLKDVDITRLIEGEKVSALIKEGKKDEDSTYVVITPVNEIVEGVITKVKDNKIVVNNVEYKIDDIDIKLQVNDYVIFEVSGKKVNVIKLVDVDKTFEAENEKAVLRKIKENELVICNGAWIDREEIQEGDVYTEMEDWSGNHYWQVAHVDTRVEGAFISYTYERIDRIDCYFVEIDNDSYRNIRDDELKVYEGENKKEVSLTALQEKDNKYLDEDVEMLVDFLGNPFILYFGDIENANNGGNFYVVVNGIWETSGKGGSVKNISLVGFDGEEVDYKLKKNATISGDLDQDVVLDNGVPVFVWVGFDSDEETIKNIIAIYDGMKSGDENYKSKYAVAAVGGEVVDNGKVLDYKVTNASVMTVTPLKDNDELVEDFEVEISEGLEDGDELPEGSFIIYDAIKKVKKAVYVLLAEEAELTELFFGKVEKYDEANSRGISYVTLNGTKYEFTSDVEFVEGDLVAYTIYKDKANIKEKFETSIVDDALIIDKETEEEVMVFTDGSQYELDEDSADVKTYKKYKVINVTLDTEKDNETLVFDDVEELNSKGLLAIENKAGNRIYVYEKNILVFTGLKVDELTNNGKLITEDEVE